MPAASSSTCRRSSGLAPIMAATLPWLTMAEARAPEPISANMVWTSRARTSRPFTRKDEPSPRAILRADLEVLRLGMRRRRQAGGFLQVQRDLGEVAARPGGGAGEDHVLHLAAAHGPGGGLAHRPAQRLDHVRLAAAIRPDDAGQARQDLDHRRFGEALEAGDAQPGQGRAQGGARAACFGAGSGAASPGVSGPGERPRSNRPHFQDQLLEPVEGHVAGLVADGAAALEGEARRGLHAELLLAPPCAARGWRASAPRPPRPGRIAPSTCRPAPPSCRAPPAGRPG